MEEFVREREVETRTITSPAAIRQRAVDNDLPSAVLGPPRQAKDERISALVALQRFDPVVDLGLGFNDTFYAGGRLVSLGALAVLVQDLVCDIGDSSPR